MSKVHWGVSAFLKMNSHALFMQSCCPCWLVGDKCVTEYGQLDKEMNPISKKQQEQQLYELHLLLRVFAMSMCVFVRKQNELKRKRKLRVIGKRLGGYK